MATQANFDPNLKQCACPDRWYTHVLGLFLFSGWAVPLMAGGRSVVVGGGRPVARRLHSCLYERLRQKGAMPPVRTHRPDGVGVAPWGSAIAAGTPPAGGPTPGTVRRCAGSLSGRDSARRDSLRSSHTPSRRVRLCRKPRMCDRGS